MYQDQPTARSLTNPTQTSCTHLLFPRDYSSPSLHPALPPHQQEPIRLGAPDNPIPFDSIPLCHWTLDTVFPAAPTRVHVYRQLCPALYYMIRASQRRIRVDERRTTFCFGLGRFCISRTSSPAWRSLNARGIARHRSHNAFPRPILVRVSSLAPVQSGKIPGHSTKKFTLPLLADGGCANYACHTRARNEYIKDTMQQLTPSSLLCPLCFPSSIIPIRTPSCASSDTARPRTDSTESKKITFPRVHRPIILLKLARSRLYPASTSNGLAQTLSRVPMNHWHTRSSFLVSCDLAISALIRRYTMQSGRREPLI